MLADIEEQYDRLYRYCYFKLRDAHLAEDITQEAFLRVFEDNRYMDMKKPEAFLYTVARNLCMDEFRRKKPAGLTQEKLKEAYTESHEDRIVDSVSLKEALDGLTGMEREMILLRIVNEVPVEDIGKIYGISRFAVYRKIKKILKKLEGRLLYG